MCTFVSHLLDNTNIYIYIYPLMLYYVVCIFDRSFSCSIISVHYILTHVCLYMHIRIDVHLRTHFDISSFIILQNTVTLILHQTFSVTWSIMFRHLFFRTILIYIRCSIVQMSDARRWCEYSVLNIATYLKYMIPFLLFSMI